MFEFPLYDFCFKIGIAVAIIAFAAGFLGTDFDGVRFSLAYYQYLYVVVIAFGGIRYGLLGGFLCAAVFATLHIVALNANEAYYKAQSVDVHYNFQIILFALIGLVTGYGYELMAQKVSALDRGYKAAVRGQGKAGGAADKAAPTDLEKLKSDVNVKNLNVLFKFTKNMTGLDSPDGLFENFMSILALDYNAKEIVVFERHETGRKIVGVWSKGWSGETSARDLSYNLGEHMPGKAVASSQMMLLDPPDPDAEWAMAVPIAARDKTAYCVAIAKWKSMRKMEPEEIQNILRMATLLGGWLDALARAKKGAA